MAFPTVFQDYYSLDFSSIYVQAHKTIFSSVSNTLTSFPLFSFISAAGGCGFFLFFVWGLGRGVCFWFGSQHRVCMCFEVLSKL